MVNDTGRFLVRCRVSRGFFDGEFLVMVASSSAYVSRDNVKRLCGPGYRRSRWSGFGVHDPEERRQGAHRVAGGAGGRRRPDLGSGERRLCRCLAMILSNEEIRKALRGGEIVVTPEPADGQYTTSAVDLFLGNEFRVWDEKLFKAKGARIELNLAEQQFSQTAAAYLVDQPREADGTVVLAPGSFVLAITRERSTSGTSRESRRGSRAVAHLRESA